MTTFLIGLVCVLVALGLALRALSRTIDELDGE